MFFQHLITRQGNCDESTQPIGDDIRQAGIAARHEGLMIFIAQAKEDCCQGDEPDCFPGLSGGTGARLITDQVTTSLASQFYITRDVGWVTLGYPGLSYDVHLNPGDEN